MCVSGWEGKEGGRMLTEREGGEAVFVEDEVGAGGPALGDEGVGAAEGFFRWWADPSV